MRRNDMGLRPIGEHAGVDRKTVRRYIDAAVGLGLDRGGDVGQLTDELIAGVVEAVGPTGPAATGGVGDLPDPPWPDQRLA